MSTQQVSVAVIAVPEDERSAHYVSDELAKWGRTPSIHIWPDGEELIFTESILVLLSSEAVTKRLSNTNSFSSYTYLHIFILDLDNSWSKSARYVLENFRKDRQVTVIDFSSTDQKDRLDELNRLIDNAVAAQTQPIQQQTTDTEFNQTSTPEYQQTATPTTPDTILVMFTDDSGNTAATYTVTPALAVLLLHARKLHEVKKQLGTNEPDLAFMSLLLAFFTLDMPVTEWFESFARRTEVEIEPQLDMLSQDVEILAEVRALTDTPPPSFSVWTSISVRTLFSEAHAIAGSTVLDVRHVMAALVYKPGNHTADYSPMMLERKVWSHSFLGFISVLYRPELKTFAELHRQTFGTNPIPVTTDIIRYIPPGPSTHIDSDRWTTVDVLGYDAYAYAIYRFLTHEKTQPPLTISLQAPWGGGKTSLMRMIQELLDPAAVPPPPQRKKNAPAPPVQQDSRNAIRRLWDSTKKRWRRVWVRGKNKLTVGEVLQEIRLWASGDNVETPPLQKDNCELMTIWFNAWKYESVNQVWAGLVDAIMNQVAGHMSGRERERFWLQLHLLRVDAEKIRKKIYEKIWSAVWRGAWWVALSVIGAAVVLFLLGMNILLGVGSVAFVTIALNVWKAFSSVRNEPADFSLNEYVTAPDYSAELGFVHHAERDLQSVFQCIPETYKPLVVFIDDLDRCSPGSVAKVMEAINLFLAGEFPNCIFVLGMDSELVAAALQAAHKDMIEALDSRAKTPVGWRFMDKFIQLPFIIPPCEPDGIDRYTSSLFAFTNGQFNETLVKQESKVNPSAGTTGIPEAGQSSTGAAPPVPPSPEEVKKRVREKINEGIKQFRDNNPEIAWYIEQGKSYFRGNPREMKRFANTFRFHYFLRWAREAQPGAKGPTPDQIVRWTVLAMKWPEVARWLHSGFGADTAAVDGAGDDRSGVHTRLARIEKCSVAVSMNQWKEMMMQEFLIEEEDEKSYHWLEDGDLFRFFQKEAGLHESERLSAGAGKGLW